MKKFLILLACAAMLGCSVKTYTSPEGASLTSMTFLWGPTVQGLEAVDGNRTLRLESQKSDTQILTEALSRALAGAK